MAVLQTMQRTRSVCWAWRSITGIPRCSWMVTGRGQSVWSAWVSGPGVVSLCGLSSAQFAADPAHGADLLGIVQYILGVPEAAGVAVPAAFAAYDAVEVGVVGFVRLGCCFAAVFCTHSIIGPFVLVVLL